jgi:sulfide:quinone oxidoreductase
MIDPPLGVVIAGGGVAGLETLIGLHALARDRVALTLLAPEDEFVYRPLAADEPFAVGRMRRASLSDAAEHAGAAFVPETIEEVEPDGNVLTTSARRRLGYDALVLAVGAEPMPIVPHALTWDDRSDAELLGGLLRDIEQGYVRRVAVVIPPGPGWPLRGYELALLVAHDAGGARGDAEITVVTPEPAPLSVLGAEAVDSLSRELTTMGVTVVSATHADVEHGQRYVVVMQPSGERLEVDRVVAVPALRGRRIAGIPADDAGFCDVDEYCRLPGLDGVWAVGDATNFPLKSGGFAAEQADVAAHDIAAVAGAGAGRRRFDPAGREALAGLPAGRFLTEWLAAGDTTLTTSIPTAAGVPLLTYLQRDLTGGWRPYG